MRKRFGDDIEVVDTSPIRALSQLGSGDFIGIYADADHFAEVINAARLVQNERILQGMPDGVVLLDSDNTILWGNGRLREWTGREDVVGSNFYDVMGTPEILGPDFCPFHTALATGRPSGSTLRCFQNRYMRVHAAPVIDAEGSPQNLVVTIREVTDEVLQQQKLSAIHQAGIELADLTPDEVSKMTVEERIELLRANILHCTQDVLQYNVVEIRMLDQNTKALEPVLAVGMTDEAANRALRADTVGNGVTGFVAATGKSYLCEDTSEDPLYLEGCAGARSSLTVPVMLHDRVTGTLNVESPEPRAFSESDLQFLEIFARDVAMALNTLELLAAEKASTAAASVEAIHSRRPGRHRSPPAATRTATPRRRRRRRRRRPRRRAGSRRDAGMRLRVRRVADRGHDLVALGRVRDRLLERGTEVTPEAQSATIEPITAKPTVEPSPRWALSIPDAIPARSSGTLAIAMPGGRAGCTIRARCPSARGPPRRRRSTRRAWPRSPRARRSTHAMPTRLGGAGSDPLDDAALEHRRERARQAEPEHEQAGDERRVPLHVLEVLGDDEQHPVATGERREDDHERGGVGRAAEQPHVHHRLPRRAARTSTSPVSATAATAKSPRIVGEAQLSWGASMSA